MNERFITHKGEMQEVAALTPQQFEEFKKTGKFPQEILDKLAEDDEDEEIID
jgi:hypothetical protein